jgi:hypothetical protein
MAGVYLDKCSYLITLGINIKFSYLSMILAFW